MTVRNITPGTGLALPNQPGHHRRIRAAPIWPESGEKERIVSFVLPKKDRKKLAAFPHMVDATILCRLVKVDLGNGEKEILCTSLTGTGKYGHEDFEQLYHYRWNEEEACKLLKSRAGLDDFSGKTEGR